MKLPEHPPRPPSATAFEPMQSDTGPASLIENLLKHPGRIIHDLHHEWRPSMTAWLLALALIGIAIYGIVVGSLSGGTQMLIAPAKLALGMFIAVLICLPSLYIFTCLGGIDARIRTVVGVLFAAVCLNALLLIGFAPVAWIFSQSTDSVALMGALHILFWAIGLIFGLRLIRAMSAFLGSRGNGHLKIWGIIFTLVCLQMTATLRPIIGRADTFLPREKKFFLAHWFDSLGGKSSTR